MIGLFSYGSIGIVLLLTLNCVVVEAIVVVVYVKLWKQRRKTTNPPIQLWFWLWVCVSFVPDSLKMKTSVCVPCVPLALTDVHSSAHTNEPLSYSVRSEKCDMLALCALSHQLIHGLSFSCYFQQGLRCEWAVTHIQSHVRVWPHTKTYDKAESTPTHRPGADVSFYAHTTERRASKRASLCARALFNVLALSSMLYVIISKTLK